MSISRFLKFALVLLTIPAAAPAQAKIADLEKAVKADSNDPVAHVSVALAYWNAKRWPDVEREAKAALVLDPRMAMAHLLMATLPYATRKTLWAEGVSPGGFPSSVVADVAESDKQFKLAFFLDPLVNTSIFATVAGVQDSNDVTTAAKDSLTNKTTDAAGTAKLSASWFVHGVIACNEGRYDDCSAAFVKYFSSQQGSSVARVPKAVYWYNGLGIAHSKEKNYASAAAVFGTLSNRKDDDTRALTPNDVARIPLRTNDFDFLAGVLMHKYNNAGPDAIVIYQRALAADPSLYLAHVYLADIYESQRSYDRAITERTEAMKVNSDDPMLHYELGLTYAKAGKLPEAVQHLGTATTLMPRNALAWYWLGQAKDMSGDKPGAKAAYAKTIAMANSRQTALVTAAKAKMGS